MHSPVSSVQVPESTLKHVHSTCSTCSARAPRAAHAQRAGAERPGWEQPPRTRCRPSRQGVVHACDPRQGGEALLGLEGRANSATLCNR
jgi:hypothetical protein